ncbi:MAG: glycosyltransferase [Caldilinea sp. CFX5]|nr:glycosyltransferase [Caldilinea sp. CFX5]
METQQLMTKLGIFVGENGHWGFFREIFADFQQHYQTDLFQPKTFGIPLLYGRLNRWAYDGQIRSMLKHNDVCFFEWASELLKPASYIDRHAPIVTRLHSYEVHVWAPQIHWENVDRIVFVSHYIRQKFLEQFPDQANKTTVIYNGVNLSRFQPPDRCDFRFNIGMLCSFHPVKRIYEAVITIAKLKQAGYNPHLHIAGGKWPGGHFDGYHIAIERLIEKLALADNVTLYGHVQGTEAWLQTIDVFLSNSYWEGQSVSLLEAMASGCYCLSHFWDGIEDVLPAECIFGLDDELHEKLITYAELPAAEKCRRRTQMRQIAAEKFDLRRTTQALHEVIESAVSKRVLA